MAFQTVTPIRLAQASMTTSYLAIYTCPTDARTYMKDIMETNSDHSPVSIPLKNVFVLP